MCSIGGGGFGACGGTECGYEEKGYVCPGLPSIRARVDDGETSSSPVRSMRAGSDKARFDIDTDGTVWASRMTTGAVEWQRRWQQRRRRKACTEQYSNCAKNRHGRRWATRSLASPASTRHHLVSFPRTPLCNEVTFPI